MFVKANDYWRVSERLLLDVDYLVRKGVGRIS